LAANAPSARRRITVVELLVVAAIAGLFAAIAIPILLGDEESPQAAGVAAVQDAVRRYQADTGSYPTFGATPVPNQPPVNIWLAGRLPSADSSPAYAGIDFDAKAARAGQQATVTFTPDYVKTKPRHAGEAAADGTQRWRLDRDGAVTVQLDGRSY
jgi:hypothetical protein